MKLTFSMTRRLLRIFVILSFIAIICLGFKASPVQAAPPIIRAEGSFETAGIIISLPVGSNGNESATIEYKRASDSLFRTGYPFTRYDGNNMATSLFNLTPGTTYDLKVTYNDPESGVSVATSQVTTRIEFSLPSGSVIRTVGASGADYTTIQAALTAAQPGWEIRVNPGIYGPVSISGKAGTAAAPIIVRAADYNNKPVIDTASAADGIRINNSSYIYFSGLEVRRGTSTGVYFHSSSHLVLEKSYIHDYGPYGILIARAEQYSGGILAAGQHLIQDNEISNTSGNPRTDNKRGITIDNNGGRGIVIRRNTIHFNYDNIKLCQDEATARVLSENTPQVLAVTGGTWANYDREVYDNNLYNGGDDLIEVDGLCVNTRIFRNTMGNSYAAFSAAPVMPGPVFVLRNTIEADLTESTIKLNTGGQDNIPERNVYFFHNTFIRKNAGGGIGNLLNLWYAVPGDHNVPLKNYVFRNNIFLARQNVKATDTSISRWPTENPSFNYNLWYTPLSSGTLFEWWTGSMQSFTSFASFRAGSGQEANGVFAEPNLDSQLRPQTGSAAIDRGVLIPGINDVFSGSAPDLGAIESFGGGPTDTVPPVVSMTSPANNSSITGTTVTVSANASDNVGMGAVQFLLDGNALGIEDEAAPYSITWNSTQAPNGSHILSARARDASGNVTTSTGVAVTVSNSEIVPPVVTGPDVIETFTSSRTYPDGSTFGACNLLTMETSGSPTFANPSLRYLFATSPQKSDAFIIRSTNPLPATYKASVDIGDINFDLINPADEENGMYFLTITSVPGTLQPPSDPLGNEWWHSNRKVLIDTDNNSWGGGGVVHPVFVGYYNTAVPSTFRVYNGTAWVSAWQAATSYNVNTWYTFSVEKTTTDYILSMADGLTGAVIRQASIPISSVRGATLSDYLVIGDPHTNYYNGNVKITNIRITNTGCGNSTPKQGDIDRDNDIDIFDYNRLVGRFGQTGSAGWIPEDIDSNGRIDIFDYNLLVTNFGR